MLTDAHMKAREAIIRVAHPLLGDVPMQGVFPKLSDTPGSVGSPAPGLGDHTKDILSGLGYDEAALAGLKAEGVI